MSPCADVMGLLLTLLLASYQCSGQVLNEALKVELLALNTAAALKPQTKYCQGVNTDEKITYTRDPPFENLPLPRCYEHIFPFTMRLYTRQDPTTGQVISRNTTPKSFDASKPKTMFITHGYMMGFDIDFHAAQIPAALQAGDFNVIAVDYRGASRSTPGLAISDVRSVGTEIGVVAKKLMNIGLERSRLHCVGHSLGSHVCGVAGMYTKFGRITGLDPGGGIFENYDAKARLNTECADFVEVMHTNVKGSLLQNLGIYKPIGHVDFYPNGGGIQPACQAVNNLQALENLFTKDFVTQVVLLTGPIIDPVGICSHIMAVLYWNEAMATDCFKTKQHCSTPETCDPESPATIQSMGLSAVDYWKQGNAGIFNVPVNGKSPYCKN